MKGEMITIRVSMKRREKTTKEKEEMIDMMITLMGIPYHKTEKGTIIENETQELIIMSINMGVETTQEKETVITIRNSNKTVCLFSIRIKKSL